MPQVIIADGSYHDGFSTDGKYIVMAYSSLMMRNVVTMEEKHLFLSPQNGKDANGSTQVCNASMAPDASGRCLFLDFGYPRTSTLAGGSYGIHQYLFMVDFADSITCAIRCPANEDSWDFSEWSNQPQFAVACCRNSAGQSHAIYGIDLKKSVFLPIINGAEIEQPAMWIGEIPTLPANLSLDSLGLYDDPHVDLRQDQFKNGMLGFFKRWNELQIVFLGNSRVQAGIDCRELKESSALSMGFISTGLVSMANLVSNYLLPHAPQLKLVGIDIPFYVLSDQHAKRPGSFDENPIGCSKGYLYDKNHNFWRDGFPKGFDSAISQIPMPQAWLDSFGMVGWSCDGWKGPNPQCDGPIDWTTDNPYYKENLDDLVKIINELSLHKVHLVAIDFPESPFYRTTGNYHARGPSWETGRGVMAQLKALEKDHPYFHVYDAFQDGNHDYTDAEAHDHNHLCPVGAAKLTKRLDSLIHAILK